MIRRLVLLAGLLALLAGCAGAHHAAQTAPKPAPKAAKKQRRSKPPTKRVKLVVTVLDGDLRRRVPGAVVRLDHRRGRTGRNGVATIRAPRRKLEVTVSAPGYTTVREPVSFLGSRRRTVRIYQPKLQWPLYGATPARTQAQPDIRLRPPFRTIWSRGLGRLVEYPAVVASGTAYLGDFRATIHAISMRSGKIDWRHATAGAPRMASSPAVAGRELVYHTMGGWVHVLDRDNGRLLWSWHAGSAIESSPLVLDGIDYFGDAAGSLYALDVRTHKLRWSRDLGAKITSSVAAAGGTLYVGDYAGRLWALSKRTGSTRWIGQVNGKIYGTPAVSRGRVFVPSSTGDSLTAFSTSGHELWRVQTGNYVYSSPAAWDGRVCFGSYDGWFYGVDAATGRVVWRVWAGGPISGAAVIVDGVAYAGSLAHRIVGVDARTGRRILTFPHGEFVPVSGNGMRLLLYGYNRVYAVEPRH